MIGCRACESNLKGIMDYKCVNCCVRHLGELSNKDSVKAMYRSIERFNKEVDGFSAQLEKKWADHVKNRSVGR